MGDECQYGNGAVIFTQSGYAARQFQQHFNAGMIGVNVGVPHRWLGFRLLVGTVLSLVIFISKAKKAFSSIHGKKVSLVRWPKPNRLTRRSRLANQVTGCEVSS